jgi:hypothetical protein
MGETSEKLWRQSSSKAQQAAAAAQAGSRQRSERRRRNKEESGARVRPTLGGALVRRRFRRAVRLPSCAVPWGSKCVPRHHQAATLARRTDGHLAQRSMRWVRAKMRRRLCHSIGLLCVSLTRDCGLSALARFYAAARCWCCGFRGVVEGAQLCCSVAHSHSHRSFICAPLQRTLLANPPPRSAPSSSASVFLFLYTSSSHVQAVFRLHATGMSVALPDNALRSILLRRCRSDVMFSSRNCSPCFCCCFVVPLPSAQQVCDAHQVRDAPSRRRAHPQP